MKMKQTSEITRDELKKSYKENKPLKNKGELKNNSVFSEAELIPYMKLLYSIYTDNLKIQS